MFVVRYRRKYYATNWLSLKCQRGPGPFPEASGGGRGDQSIETLLRLEGLSSRLQARRRGEAKACGRAPKSIMSPYACWPTSSWSGSAPPRRGRTWC